MFALVYDTLKFRATVLLLAFIPLLHPSVVFGRDILATSPPAQRVYDCFGLLVDEDTHAALTELAELNRPIVDELFSVGDSCGGVFSLDYAPILVEVETPTGKIVKIPELETIPGEYVHGEGVTEPFECEIYGYWESDFTQPPWTDELTPEQLDQLLAVNGVIGLVWAKLSTAQGEVYVAWQIIQFDTGADDPARAVILLADGSQATGSEISQFHEWRSILRDWLGEGEGLREDDDPPGGWEPPPWDDGPRWDVPPTPLVPPDGPPGWDYPVPTVPCEDTPEYQDCLEFAKDMYYDCLRKASDDLDDCLAHAAHELVYWMASCVLGAFIPWPVGFLAWAACAAAASRNYLNDTDSCMTTYSLRKASCRNTYYIDKLSCCTQYE